MNADASTPRVVSGAARGIGEATVRLFAEHGYAVVASYVLPLDRWDLEPGIAAISASLDVRDEAAVAALVRRADDELGRIDVLANIAGIVLVKPLDETTWDEYRQVADVNLGGTFLACKHVLPVMKRQGSGSIVNMAPPSVATSATADDAVYGSTKVAVIGLCRALAWEVAPWNIRVNSLSPGSVDTPMLRGDIEIESARLGPAARRGAGEPRGRAGARALAWTPPRSPRPCTSSHRARRRSSPGTDLLVDEGGSRARPTPRPRRTRSASVVSPWRSRSIAALHLGARRRALEHPVDGAAGMTTTPLSSATTFRPARRARRAPRSWRRRCRLAACRFRGARSPPRTRGSRRRGSPRDRARSRRRPARRCLRRAPPRRAPRPVAVQRIAAARDDHVAGLGPRHRAVEHQVLTGRELDGERPADDPAGRPERPQAGRERRRAGLAERAGVELREPLDVLTAASSSARRGNASPPW